MTHDWQGRPYHPISLFYHSRFGGKVFKIPVALAEDCPNRRGLKGMETCIFCDVHGSFAYPENAKEELREQIHLHREKKKNKGAQAHLIYFQAYTTTFTQIKNLRQALETALEFDDVVGVVLGTRPDCISPAVLDLWHEYSQKTFVAVELGVQSFDDEQLIWMKRGHTAEQSIQGIYKVRKACPDVNLGVHLMFGWPGETLEDVRAAAHSCNMLPIDNVKLHNLHVLKHTPLEKLYHEGRFEPVPLESYARMVGEFLAHLNPATAVHRLAALASRWEELVAPPWASHRMRNYQYILDFMREQDLYQGKHFAAAPRAGAQPPLS